ncbi:hypothetical protein [Geminocystis sp. NIES-3709]|uniref:hypothetical protein n=1 Tax=Geminocystis sp. NIES-3709 TaxID=1617448 RepID=UPI0005FCD4A3|nr:hypothetical protein [Geminocystis sp. NIES-3709]BAQ63294.1 hypothetical protein GM3709_59 [Geminocystis sp. NIES-3709]
MHTKILLLPLYRNGLAGAPIFSSKISAYSSSNFAKCIKPVKTIDFHHFMTPNSKP